MKIETQQKILSALNQVFSDLSDWMRAVGVPEDKVDNLFNQMMSENGLGSRLLINSASNRLPIGSVPNLDPSQIALHLERAKSGEFATWLSTQPEPSEQQLGIVLSSLKDALPNLREHLVTSAKPGPRHRRGGRPTEIEDPAERDKIRQEIKMLREPGVRIQDLDKRFAAKYGVSPTAIKRIRLEKKNRPT